MSLVESSRDVMGVRRFLDSVSSANPLLATLFQRAASSSRPVGSQRSSRTTGLKTSRYKSDARFAELQPVEQVGGWFLAAHVPISISVCCLNFESLLTYIEFRKAICIAISEIVVRFSCVVAAFLKQLLHCNYPHVSLHKLVDWWFVFVLLGTCSW